MYILTSSFYKIISALSLFYLLIRFPYPYSRLDSFLIHFFNLKTEGDLQVEYKRYMRVDHILSSDNDHITNNLVVYDVIKAISSQVATKIKETRINHSNQDSVISKCHLQQCYQHITPTLIIIFNKPSQKINHEMKVKPLHYITLPRRICISIYEIPQSFYQNLISNLFSMTAAANMQ